MTVSPKKKGEAGWLNSKQFAPLVFRPCKIKEACSVDKSPAPKMPSNDNQASESFPSLAGGRYTYLSDLGKGMAGRVFKARDQVLKKNVVIKTLHSDLSCGEELQRFQREAKAFSSLEHPNILKVLDFGLSEDQVPYLVMAYVEGESFDKYLAKNAPLSGHAALLLTAQICQAMQHAPSRGVLHRDLKPSNLLILEDSRGELHIFILDFGLAKVNDPNSGAISTLTKPGQLLGTAEYMSPEQASGQKCESASDIYSVGCILFEMVSGTPPFTGIALLEIIRQQREESPPLEQLRAQSPDIDVASIVEKALEKNPRDRFSTMQEMHDAIDAAFQVLPPSEGTIAYPTPAKHAIASESTRTALDCVSPKRKLRP
ncbi:MAG: serine/threonine protein kinase, partial [Candidatus Obscuribacterales bacterium]|nr:serine/threonine protein kinase [Candidatus Obscuribacterales bacterium]